MPSKHRPARAFQGATQQEITIQARTKRRGIGTCQADAAALVEEALAAALGPAVERLPLALGPWRVRVQISIVAIHVSACPPPPAMQGGGLQVVKGGKG